MKKLKFLLFLLIPFSLISCQKNNDEVVIYTSVDQVFSEPILQDFENKTGIKVKAIYDTEETKSTGVLNRLLAEKNNPQADVFWSGDPLRTIVLQNNGITAVYKSANSQDIATNFIDKNHNWTGFSARARVLICNKKKIPVADMPHSLLALSDKKYSGNIAIANPLFGTTTFHIAALFTVLGDDVALDFLYALKRNKIIIATSNGDVKKKVLQAEVACGLTDSDDAFEALKENKSIELIFLDQDGIGSLIMPNTLNLIKNSQHSENGKKLIDFLLSRETERKLAKSCAQMPLHSGVSVPDNIPSLDNIKAMQIDYQKASLKLQTIQPLLKKWLED